MVENEKPQNTNGEIVPEEKAENREEKKPIKTLRTYQGDVEEALSKTKSSAATIMLAEQKKRESSPIVIERPRNLAVRNKTFMVTGISLLVLGAIVVGAVYFVRSNEKVKVEMRTKAIIAFSEEHPIQSDNLSRDIIISRIISEKQSYNAPPNSVLFLNFSKQNLEPYSVSDILPLLAPKIPQALGRTFENKYMIGIYSYFEGNEPFILFTTEDFPIAYSNMLKWERDMVSDLGRIFNISQSEYSSALFIDETVKNKDLRVLKNSSQKTVLLYSFIDKNTLVITGNENIFNAINGKYLINKQVR